MSIVNGPIIFPKSEIASAKLPQFVYSKDISSTTFKLRTFLSKVPNKRNKKLAKMAYKKHKKRFLPTVAFISTEKELIMTQGERRKTAILERGRLSSFFNKPVLTNTKPAKTTIIRDAIFTIKGKIRFSIVLLPFYPIFYLIF